MTKKIFASSFILILIASQLSGQIVDQTALIADTIPFKLTEHNNIAIESILNNNDTIDLMFHTGVSSISLTPEQTEKLKNDENKKSTDAQSWSGKKDIEYIENNQLKITHLEWNNLNVWLDLLSGPETNGKFGPHLFENKLIEINFDDLIIVLHLNKEEIKNLSEYQSFKMSTNDHDALFIEGTMAVNQANIENKYMIHSGYGGTIILDDQFYKKNSEINTLEVIGENDLKDSFGNIIKTKKTLVEKFSIGNIQFQNVPVSYFDSEIEIQQTSILGGEILKRMNMILDIKNMTLYAKPNQFSFNEFVSKKM